MEYEALRQTTTDEELYRRMRRGDQGALVLLYERHRERLYRFALHMSGNRSAAQEIAQDVFLHLLGSGVRFDEQRGSLEAYLYGIARNLLRRLRPAIPLEQFPERAASDDMLGDLISDETTAALYRAIQELPQLYREAIVLCDLEERSYEDCARLAGCPVGTIRSRLHRARGLLAAKLKEEQTANRDGAGKQHDRVS